MNLDELHRFLTTEFDLIAEATHSGSWRTYFFQKIIWDPAQSSRAVKVLLDQQNSPFKIQLCASSDNNNSVFISAPFDLETLKVIIKDELSRLRALH